MAKAWDAHTIETMSGCATFLSDNLCHEATHGPFKYGGHGAL